MFKFFISCFVILLFSSCDQNNGKENNKAVENSTAKDPDPVKKIEVPSKVDLSNKISALEKELYEAKELNIDKANAMIALYETYYNNYFRDYACADYLFKAGELAENINQPYRAIGFYTKCYEEYPAYKLNNLCLFRMANLYDFKLNNYIKAKALYMEVQEKFPKTDLASDAGAAIKMMGKSDQEMIKEFEKKNNIKK